MDNLKVLKEHLENLKVEQEIDYDCKQSELIDALENIIDKLERINNE